MGRTSDRTRAVTIAAVALATVVGATSAEASDFTIGGAFDTPNDLLLIQFSSLGGPFLAFTSQWNGGVPAGSLPPAASPSINGFDSQLQLFDGIAGSAPLLIQVDDGASGFSATVGGTTFTGGQWDAGFLGTLAAGSYTLGLTNYNNDPANGGASILSDGYNNNGFDGSTGTFGFTGPEFRVHLLGIDQISNVQSPNPVSISGPFETCFECA